MGPSPSRPAVTVLVTDMDNTLCDWLGMWQADTLRTIRAAGTLVVAYTESRAYYADYRVRTLGLDGVLALPTHVLTDGFAELLRLIAFHRFMPRRPPASPAA